MDSRVCFSVCDDDPEPLKRRLDEVFDSPGLAPASLEFVFDVPGVDKISVLQALRFREAVEPYREYCAKYCYKHVIRTPDCITQMIIRGALTLFKPVVKTEVVVGRPASPSLE